MGVPDTIWLSLCLKFFIIKFGGGSGQGDTLSVFKIASPFIKIQIQSSYKVYGIWAPRPPLKMSFSTVKKGSQPLTSSHVASLLFPKHTNHVLASEPLHLLSPLFPQTSQAWFPDLFRSLSQCHLLTILYRIALPPNHHSLAPCLLQMAWYNLFLFIFYLPLKHCRHSPWLPVVCQHLRWPLEDRAHNPCLFNKHVNEWVWGWH